MRLGALKRAVTLSALTACAVAVIVARSTPRAGAFHDRREPHQVVFDEMHFSSGGLNTRVLDLRTGDVSPWVLAGTERLQRASFSGRVNERGEREVAGRWVRRTTTGGNCGVESTGVGRFLYPSGRALDRVPLDLVPASPPCWYPGDPPRVLFAASDGRLYRLSFHNHAEPSDADESDVRAIEWPNPPDAARNGHIGSPVWYNDPRLGNTLIAAVGCNSLGEGSDGAAHLWYRFRLWWLRLDAGGSEIVDSGPLFADSTPEEQQGLPSVTSLPDGELLMAFLRRPCVANSGDVYIVRLEVDERTGVPSARLSDCRKVTEECALVPLPFSPDGRWVYALERQSDGSARFARHELSLILATPRS